MVRRASVQRNAVDAISRHGAAVLYDWQFKNGVADRQARLWAPKWLVDQIGIDYFGKAVYVFASGRKTEDATSVAIGCLDQLERLEIGGSAVTDGGLANLRSLTRLRYMDLAASEIGDAGLAHLRCLTSLEFLNLNATQVGDAGLLSLNGLTNLETLYLWRTQVSDAGLGYLRGLRRLKSLALQDNQVTEVGLALLTSVRSLRFLSLGDTPGRQCADPRNNPRTTCGSLRERAIAAARAADNPLRYR